DQWSIITRTWSVLADDCRQHGNQRRGERGCSWNIARHCQLSCFDEVDNATLSMEPFTDAGSIFREQRMHALLVLKRSGKRRHYGQWPMVSGLELRASRWRVVGVSDLDDSATRILCDYVKHLSFF